MNVLLRWTLAAGIASAISAGSPSAFADDKRPADYSKKDGNNRPADYGKKDGNNRPADYGKKPAPPPAYPKTPPPAPRAEAKPVKAGHVWVAGRWDWKNGKWEWQAGRHVPERKGKKWVEGRWEKKGDGYAYVDGRWIDDAAYGAGPKQAPPANRVENKPPRQGYVFVPGRWDWKNGKWEWVAGKYETERKGKKWSPGRWEKKGDVYAYVDGSWVDDAAYGAGPKQAPPPNRVENKPPRKGYVFVPGRWDWKNNKWEWVAGKYEPERKGKKWRAGIWENRGGVYAYVDGDWIDDVAARPKQAPPPNKVEKNPPRKGYVFIPGRWDWRNSKWEWVAGKYEPEQPGKKYREGRWDKVEDGYAYFEGGWVDDAPPPPPRRRPRVEKPIVGNYFPDKGKPGTRVVIFGRNFSRDAKVLWAGQPVVARVTPEQITFRVPAKATSGDLVLRDPARRRDLDVGPFEVVADYDADAERKRIEQERLKAAQAAIAARQSAFAAARAAREQAYKQRAEEYAKAADQRREERIKWYTSKWEKAFLASEDVMLEMTLHCQRLADIHQMLEVAELKNDVKLAVRIDVIRQAEDSRHEKRMAALKAKFKGGAK